MLMCHSTYFCKLCEKLKRRFGKKDPPQTARGKLQEPRQSGLSLDKFGENINELVMDVYPGAAENIQKPLPQTPYPRESITSEQFYLQWTRTHKYLM